MLVFFIIIPYLNHGSNIKQKFEIDFVFVVTAIIFNIVCIGLYRNIDKI